jgi:VanZ family protein
VSWLKTWWPALAWAVLISGFSTAAFTSEHTGRIIIPILHWLLPHASNHTLNRIHYLIRKCAHFTEYFILSLLILRGIRAGRPGSRFAWALMAIAIVACYASLDELHQHFVPGRTAAVTDVLIDTSGGIAAQAVAALLMLWGHVRQRRKELPVAQTDA